MTAHSANELAVLKAAPVVSPILEEPKDSELVIGLS